MPQARPIPVRAPRFAVDDAVPRAWLATSLRATHAANALSLLFPEGERFFIRSVLHYREAIDADPALAARVRGFVGQEGRHGHEHDRMNRMLEQQGLDVATFLARYRRLGYELLEPRVAPHLRLSTTVALEHLTATFAEAALRTGLLDDAHPVVRDLLRWHAAEEIEHKSVAFDVLARVDPRRSTRLAGLAIGVGVLGGFWTMAYASLMAQDPERGAPAASPGAARRFRREHARLWRSVRAAVADYLRDDFHPDQRDNASLARAVIEELGLAA